MSGPVCLSIIMLTGSLDGRPVRGISVASVQNSGDSRSPVCLLQSPNPEGWDLHSCLQAARQRSCRLDGSLCVRGSSHLACRPHGHAHRLPSLSTDHLGLITVDSGSGEHLPGGDSQSFQDLRGRLRRVRRRTPKRRDPSNSERSATTDYFKDEA